jgi:predicted PurR-regulated permease PerM
MESAASDNTVSGASDIILMAKESLVLVTVLVVVGVAYFVWVRIFKPFMEYQQKITEAHANALNAIQNTVRDLNEAVETQKAATSDIRQAAHSLQETQSTVLASIRALKAAS